MSNIAVTKGCLKEWADEWYTSEDLDKQEVSALLYETIYIIVMLEGEVATLQDKVAK